MPRYVAAGSAADFKEFAPRIPSELKGAGEDLPQGLVSFHYFDAPTLEAAWIYFRRLQATGCPQDMSVIGDAGCEQVLGSKATLWHGPRRTHHVLRFLAEFGVSQAVVAQRTVESSAELREINNLLNQLCRDYHEMPKENGVAQFPERRRNEVKGTLAKAEGHLACLIVRAAAAGAAMDEAYRALGVEPNRRYTIPAKVEPTKKKIKPETQHGLHGTDGRDERND